MAKIQNSDIVQGVVESLRLDVAREKIPNETGNNLIPVFISNSIFGLPNSKKITYKITGVTRTVTGTGTIFTSDSNKDTYLLGFNLSLTTDATSDSTNANIDCRPFGTAGAQEIARVNKQTTTATSNLTLSYNFTIPFRIEKGQPVRHTSSFTVGAQTLTTSVHYIEVEA